MGNQQKAILGERSDRVLKDPAVIEALTAMRQAVYDSLETTSWWNTKELRECKRRLNTLTAFEKQLRKQINEGRKAQERL